MKTLLETQEKLLAHNIKEKKGTGCHTLRIAIAKLPDGNQILVAVKPPMGEKENDTLVLPGIVLDSLGLSRDQKINLTIGGETIQARIARGNPEYSLAELYTPSSIPAVKSIRAGCSSMGIAVVEEEVNKGISSNLQKITMILAVAIAVPVAALGLRAAESLSSEVRASRIIGVSRRGVFSTVAFMGAALIPLLVALSVSASLVFYSTAVWISEYLTHTVIPRPVPSDTVELVPVQLALHVLMWISLLSGMYRRVDTWMLQ